MNRYTVLIIQSAQTIETVARWTFWGRLVTWAYQERQAITRGILKALDQAIAWSLQVA
jgi:hypothetical protein